MILKEKGFLDFCHSCHDTKSADEAFDEMAKKLTQLGIVRHHYVQAHFKKSNKLDILAMHTSFDPEYLQGFLSENMHEHDILVEFCKTQKGLALWSRQFYLADLGSLTPMQERTARYACDHRLNSGVVLSLPHEDNSLGQVVTGMSLIPEAGTKAVDFDPLVRENKDFLMAIGEVISDHIDPRKLAVQSHDLNEKECRVLGYLADGYQIQQIADAMYLSDRTTAYYAKRARTKLGARSNAQAVARALRIGAI